jgi:putative DNA primase/helicase
MADGEAEIREIIETARPVLVNGPEPAASDQPTITVVAGQRHEAADKGIAALQAAGIAFYQRDRTLVRVCRIKARNTKGGEILVPGIATVTLAILGRALGQSARWQRINNLGFAVRMDPPQAVVEQIRDMVGEWPFPVLVGVIGCPTLRPDGSLLTADGYDPSTGLFLLSGVALPPIPDRPTRHDALLAMGVLLDLVKEFPFVDAASKSVAVSMGMTAVLRGAMPIAPMHLVTAPDPGSGKSYLADVMSMIATGEQVAVIAVSPNPEETEKRLVGAALAGYPIIGLDNCREILAGEFLCQVTERPLMQLRRLGKSDPIRVNNTVCVFANGNNVELAGDLVRRSIGCRLDANVENPEMREFEGDPLGTVQRDRGKYIAACLTIARAYLVAGKPSRRPLPSYEEWSDLVRSPLVWLDQADPIATMVDTRSADPVRQDRVRVFGAWKDDLGVNRDYTVAEIVKKAEQEFGAPSEPLPNLLPILLDIAQKRYPAGKIDRIRLGRWLGKNEDAVANGLKLKIDRSDQRRVRYGLRNVGI